MTDELLWRDVQNNDRDAFGRIVERYQSLVCSVAYAGLGDVAASQDVAQEAFVAAWRQRDDLREPSKLRAWLCGIARTIAANIRRRDVRRGGAPDSLDTLQEVATSDDDPLAQAVTREEEVLLWRAIGVLPVSYREPIVLFYREEQSIAQVAIQLDLSQETVKQRLSRGRSMLRSEVAALVESALSRSRPGPGFTAGVLAAVAVSLPSTSAAAVVSAVAASSAKGAGSASFGGSVVAGPAIGVATTWIMAKVIRMNGRSPEEQAVVGRRFRNAVLGVLALVAVLLATLLFGGQALLQWPRMMAVGITIWTAVLLGGIFRLSTQLERDVARIRVQTGTTDAEYAPVLAARGMTMAGPRRYESSWRLLGLPIFAFASGGATVGVLSLSLLGLAVGGLAVGSLAAGWWAVGFVAVAWESAVGLIAIPETLTAGQSTWFVAPSMIFLALIVPIVVVLSIVIPAVMLARRAWLLRRPVRSTHD